MNKKEEIQEKLERLMRVMADEGLSGMLINTQHNFAWLTAGGRNGIDLSRDAGAGSLLVRRDCPNRCRPCFAGDWYEKED